MPDPPDQDTSSVGHQIIGDFHLGEDGAVAYDALTEIESLYADFSEAMTEILQRDSTGDTRIPLKARERTLLLEFYTVVHAHVERLSAALLFEELADDQQGQSSSTFRFFRDEFSQQQREGLLFQTGIIDSGMKGELTKIRQARNTLVHEQHKRMYIDPNHKSESDVDRAFNVVTTLDAQLNDITGIDLRN
jgi:hypothetical protein